ncbi:HlyC/CorC family transporter [Sideroxydans lithotrophicus]|uniref:Magnesium and cobalt efflux protein CorC n=1 Tax=Sideroxydans lithotrophicus (strain ES-1) TaxID=580332 RepID=D5CM88_SIDLE|nr:transporter associated domain-containing protein [Sideroxydans lithotrophicus]ADE10702.1 CBS domain containing protein [Sideroxydans lithotrophicus ES-1]
MDGSESSHKPTLLERLSTMLLREPEDREQLIALMHSAYERNLLDADALSMMEGVIQVSERQVREIMIPRAQMDVIDISQPPEQFIPYVIETAHSRFPVTDGDKDNIIGILLAKDLLRYYAGEEFDVRDMLRPAVFVPESKRLNVLLRDFRSNRNHIALVVDEYGGVCGMVTIEDVLEQIVGDIADEYDFDEDGDNIIRADAEHWRVKADTKIADFNETLGTEFNDEEYDTIGGLVLKSAGQLPKRGESFQVGEWRFTVLRADSRRLHSLLAERSLIESGEQG